MALIVSISEFTYLFFKYFIPAVSSTKHDIVFFLFFFLFLFFFFFFLRGRRSITSNKTFFLVAPGPESMLK